MKPVVTFFLLQNSTPETTKEWVKPITEQLFTLQLLLITSTALLLNTEMEKRCFWIQHKHCLDAAVSLMSSEVKNQNFASLIVIQQLCLDP